MLSRTADHLFWMSRYLERAENLARLLDVTWLSGPGRLRGTFMKSSGFSLYHLFMASMGGTCPRAFWGMW
jgi:hypothetical protein